VRHNDIAFAVLHVSGRRLKALDMDVRADIAVPAVEHAGDRWTGRQHAGQRGEALLRLFEERDETSSGAAGLVGRRPHLEQMAAIEAEVFGLQIAERADEQAGSNHKHERGGDLRHQQRFADTEASAGRVSVRAASQERRGKRDTGTTEGGRESEEDAVQ
jgi:hypothetical protein